MKLPAKVKDINEVAANLRGLYKQEGDEYVLRSDDAGVQAAISAITGLTGALEAARREAGELKAAKTVDLSPLSEYGTDPAAIATTVKQTIETLNAAKGDQAKALEQVRKEMSAANTAAIQVKDKEVEALNVQLNAHLVDARIAAAASAHGVDLTMIDPFIRPNVTVMPDANGKRRPVIKDAAGNVMYSTKVAGAEMGIEEYMGSLLEQDRFKVLLPSKAKSGGDAAQSGRTAATKKDVSMTPAQRISAGLAARAAGK